MTAPDASTDAPRRRDRPTATGRDRSRFALLAYRFVRRTAFAYFWVFGGFRVGGRENVPEGAAILVSNHLSFWDVLVLGAAVPRPMNFVARSSLFTPVLGPMLRLFGAFPIQREGIGAQGFKETLRRLKRGGIVVLFPEGTRTPDGELQELKAGIASLAVRARVPVVPAGIAGTFEAWPRHRRFPRPHPIRVHVGPPIAPEELADLPPEAATALIRDRMRDAIAVARQGLEGTPGRRPDAR